jgi:hypothetical protein
MADFDSQGPADNEAKDKAPKPYGSEQCDDSGSCCGGSGRWRQDEGESCETDSFVADWSGAEKTLEAQAAAFEATHAEARKPEAFWVELVQSQQPTAPETESSTALTVRFQTRVGVQSEQFWADLVASQKTGETSPAPLISTLSNPPTGMGWSEDEASEWSPPEREERTYEPVQDAGEPVEIEASARRDDVEWSQPASAEQDFETARSEGMAFDVAGESSAPTLMSAAVEAARKQAKAKKASAKKPAEKKVKAKKAPATKAKKPAAKKAAAKKPTAKKVVKKVTPAPKITKAPTRRAA